MGATTEVLVPARHGRAFPVPKGALLEIIDPEGQQVADFISVIEGNPTEWLSATHTRSTTLRLNRWQRIRHVVLPGALPQVTVFSGAN